MAKMARILFIGEHPVEFLVLAISTNWDGAD